MKVEVTATGDFGVTPGTRTVTIPTSGYATFRIATTDDDVDEPDGTVTITLKADRRYTIGPDSTATGLIRDDDLTLGGLKQGQGSPPSKPEVSVTGVIDGEEGEHVIFFLEADPPPSIPTAVLLKVTATGDYRVKTGTRIISLPAGSGHANLRIPTRDDDQDEPDGTVTVTLQAGHAYTVGAISSQTGHILDNDITPPQVSVADAIAQEGDDLEFVISLSYPVNGPVTVYYNTLDWYAWSPEDYASVLGWLTIPAGDTEATVRVATVVDDLDEENEKMLLDISGIEGGGAVLEDGRADGIISDDPVDTTPKPELSISGGSGITEGGTATFTITASFAPEDPHHRQGGRLPERRLRGQRGRDGHGERRDGDLHRRHHRRQCRRARRLGDGDAAKRQRLHRVLLPGVGDGVGGRRRPAAARGEHHGRERDHRGRHGHLHHHRQPGAEQPHHGQGGRLPERELRSVRRGHGQRQRRERDLHRDHQRRLYRRAGRVGDGDAAIGQRLHRVLL